MTVSILLVLLMVDNQLEVRTALFKNNKACESYKSKVINEMRKLKITDYRVECLEDTLRE